MLHRATNMQVELKLFTLDPTSLVALRGYTGSTLRYSNRTVTYTVTHWSVVKIIAVLWPEMPSNSISWHCFYKNILEGHTPRPLLDGEVFLK